MARAAGALVLVAATLTSGCGYALAGRGSFLPDYVQVVGIPQLQNATTFFQVEQILTEKVRTEFIGRGRYTVIPAAEGADAVLTGTVSSITLTPSEFDAQQRATRYIFALTMNAVLTDVRTAQPLWSNPALTFREEYELSAEAAALEGAAFVSQERASLERITTDAARSIVTSILEAF